MEQNPEDILLELTNHLISHIQLEHIVTDKPVPALPRTPKQKKSAEQVNVAPQKPVISSPASDKVNALEELKKIALVCTKCRLSETRTQVVFGVGNPDADLVFVGEAPGHDEDVQGIPFVGRAGQLLTDMIEHPRSLDMKRSDVYICNVIKCRPPNNRNPEPDEIDCCEPYLLQQLDIIQPKVICALGKFASQTLLRSETPISKLRGNWFEYHGIPLMPTFHPAALLRNPGWKKDVWADILLVKEKLTLLKS
jgi:uracil-DNA glycosylase family 4